MALLTDMNILLEKNLERMKKYCQEFDVEKLHAFGSITSKNFTGESDIDLLVKFKNIPCEKYADNYFRLHELFELIFKRKVDLVTENSLSNPYFIKSINQTKTLLYEGKN
jgi:uncharacterized protein